VPNEEHVRRLLESADSWNQWRDENILVVPNLAGADLSGADLADSIIAYTILGDLDLRDVKGLESVRHFGPSSIGIDTIYKSNGEIPEVFLRGCGVPEEMIAFIRASRAIRFYSCFISDSTKDQEFADRVYNDLRACGVRCWFAPHDVKGGRKLHEQIDEAIRLHEKLHLIISPNTMESEWVKTEISQARARELRDGPKVLFPIQLCSYKEYSNWRCFDTGSGTDHAHEIRSYAIPDFSDWKNHDSYKREFDKLVRDLKPAK
jgi:hypothetical protein